MKNLKTKYAPNHPNWQLNFALSKKECFNIYTHLNNFFLTPWVNGLNECGQDQSSNEIRQKLHKEELSFCFLMTKEDKTVYFDSINELQHLNTWREATSSNERPIYGLYEDKI
jgi:hypothetical protein